MLFKIIKNTNHPQKYAMKDLEISEGNTNNKGKQTTASFFVYSVILWSIFNSYFQF